MNPWKYKLNLFFNTFYSLYYITHYWYLNILVYSWKEKNSMIGFIFGFSTVEKSESLYSIVLFDNVAWTVDCLFVVK